MTYACFTVEIADHIAHIRFNRPDKANSMTPEFWKELPEVVDRISNDAEARVIVISSEGKHFTAGMDISVFMSGSLDGDSANAHVSAEAFRYKIKALQETFSALERARQPADAFFAVQETAIGMTADVGTFPRLVKLIPEGWARQMAYTAERLPAAKALQIGLVNEVFDSHEDLLDGVMAIARKIAAHSPLAVAGCKAMANYSRDHSTADALDYISVWNAAMLRPDDIREAYVAKGEKRPPVFDGLKPVSR